MRSWLFLICAGRFGASLSFMMYAGALPFVLPAWSMSAGQAGAVQAAFNIGYAASLVVSSWLADRVGAARVLLWSSALAACCAMAFALIADSYASGLVLFAALGLAQGGTYGPSIMLVAQGVEPVRRGAAVGWLLAAASLGYFASIALSNILSSHWGYRPAFLVCALGALLGAMAASMGVRMHPRLIVRRASSTGGSKNFLRDRRSALLTAGYTAHCWELLGMWAWLPAFLFAALGAREGSAAVLQGLLVAAVTHLSGVAASVAMGRASDRLGRRFVLQWTAAAGAACSFAIGWTLGAPSAVLIVLAAFYGFAAIGDSPVLSTAMTESVDAGALGTALAVRSILGFGAGGLAPLAFGVVLDAGADGAAWGPAFSVLGVGGVLAAVFARCLPADVPR